MRAFAEWLSSQRYRSALVATLFGLFPLLAIPSAGVVVLSGLRHGSREALLVVVAATFFLALAHALTGSDVRAALALSAGLWLPVIAVTELLRRSNSLSLCLQATVVGVLALVLALFAAGNPVEEMRALLEAMRAEVEAALQTRLEGAAIAGFARGFTAALFGGMLFMLVAGLLLGRWWASLLSGGEGFAPEFRRLRMGRVLAIVVALVFVIYLLTRAAVLESMLFVLGAGFALQGLAVMHAAAAAQGLHVAWLIAMYVALFATALYAAVVVGLVGWLDTWLDLRARLARGREPRDGGG